MNGDYSSPAHPWWWRESGVLINLSG